MSEHDSAAANLRTDYRNPDAGFPRRFASLWAQTELLGWLAGFVGLAAGALPSAVEAAIYARKTSPPPISALRLITLGSLSTASAMCLPISLVPGNLLLFDIFGISGLLRRVDAFNTGHAQYSVYNAETLLAAALGAWSMRSVQQKIDLKLAAHGLPAGPARVAGLALGAGGVVLGGIWRDSKAKEVKTPEAGGHHVAAS
uniref:Uncharacterized protein n=1 Tax=Mycena chlorophos TaxID=658473 RepID=A0ABQ0KY65_MYCCL|nr:predicted protein [Mycena chlorophos]